MEYARIEAVFKSVEDNRDALIEAYEMQIKDMKEKRLNREKRLSYINAKVFFTGGDVL